MDNFDYVAILALIVAILSVFLTIRGARLQVESMLFSLLLDKAKEANEYSDTGEKTQNRISYQNSIACLVQGIQIYEYIRKIHRFLLFKLPRNKFQNIFYLKLRTHLQNKLFIDTTFEEFLTSNQIETDVEKIKSHLNKVRNFFKETITTYPQQ